MHTPEFFWEKPYAKVETASKKFGIGYPVVQDNGYAIWRSYGIWAWPTTVLVNNKGAIRYHHIGEAAYKETESVIQRLLADAS